MLEGPVGDDLDAENGACEGGQRRISSCVRELACNSTPNNPPAVTAQHPGRSWRSESGQLTCDGKDLLEHVLGHTRAEIPDVEMRALGRLAAGPDERPARGVPKGAGGKRASVSSGGSAGASGGL